MDIMNAFAYTVVGNTCCLTRKKSKFILYAFLKFLPSVKHPPMEFVVHNYNLILFHVKQLQQSVCLLK